MKRLLILLSLFLKILPMQAAVDEVQLAQAYFEAGNYAQAKIEYEGLIEEGQPQWKNEILRYNIATSLLAEGRQEEALLLLETLADQEMEYPFLKKNIFFNLVLTRLEQIKNSLAELKKKPEATYEDYWKIHVLFVRSKEDLKAAELAWCDFEAAEGAPKCPSSDLLSELNSEFQRLIEDFSQTFTNSRLSHVSAQEEKSVKGLLQRLLNTYTITLMQEPLQEAQLAQLLKTQTDLGDRLKSGFDPSISKNFSDSLNFLKLSVKSLAKIQPVKTRFFAEVARFYMKEAVEQLHSHLHVEPKQLLEAAIAKEEFILFLQHLRGQISSEDFIEADPLFVVLQKTVMDHADQFLTTVLKKQKEAFAQQGPSKNRCQCSPWNEVIPLYSEGYASALLAYQVLKKAPKENSVKSMQKTAVNRWNEALIKMKNPSLEEKQSFHEMEQPKEQSSSENKMKNEKLDAVQKLVQEMEEDDKSRPQILKTSSGIKRQERPW